MANAPQSSTPDLTFYASGVPLPEDSSESLVLGERHGVVQAAPALASRSSLDVLTQNDSVSHATAPVSLTALLSGLPDSDVALLPKGLDNLEPLLPGPNIQEGSGPTAIQLHETATGEVVEDPPFAQRVRQLGLSLPHLDNVKYSSRQKRVALDCYDFSGQLMTSTWHAAFRNELHGLYTDENIPLERVLRQEPVAGVNLRLLVADDLSSDLVELLGSLLDISPEAFEEHLIDSGWRNGTSLDREADTWITRNMVKDYISIKWYRPVLKRFQKPETFEDRMALLKPRESKPPLSWVEEIYDSRNKLHRLHHSVRPLSNILRKAWDIYADVADRKSTRKSVAWEERATVWSRTKGSFQIIVVFLDPLPIVSHHARGAEIALETLGLYPLDSRSTTSATNPNETVSITAQTGEIPPSTTPNNAPIRKRTRVGRHTLGSGGLLSVPAYVLNLFRGKFKTNSRNMADPENSQANDGHVFMPSRPYALANQPGFPTIAVHDGGTVNYVEADVAAVGEEIGVEIFTLDPRERSLFHGLLPRGPPVDYTLIFAPENSPILQRHLNTETSTATDLANWIHHGSQWSGRSAAHFGPMDCLFAIIHKDTLNTLCMMDQALTQIGREILDDSLIQQRLMNWRLLLERFGQELRAMDASLRQLARFISSTAMSYSSKREADSSMSALVSGLLEDGLAEVAKLQQRTTSSYQSLMTNMSIVESKRGIAEAEGVSKLTELAFFFIPLTFSASIFSMQVKELKDAKISVSTFVTLAVIVTSLSYASRLFIRSQSFTRRRLEWIQDIRVDAGLSPNVPIPTTTVIVWLWRRLGLLIIVVVLTVALNVSPIVVLWTRDMNRGFKALLTVLLLFLSLFGSYVMIVALLYVDGAGLHFQSNMFKHELRIVQRSSTRNNQSLDVALLDRFSWMRSSWFLISLAATALVTGPLAALWTRSLTLGIRLGATFAIGSIYLSFVVFVLLKAMSEGKFTRQQEDRRVED